MYFTKFDSCAWNNNYLQDIFNWQQNGKLFYNVIRYHLLERSYKDDRDRSLCGSGTF